MLLDGGAFTALLLLISGVSAEIVVPPTNVAVSCQNFHVAVSWEYSKQQPQTFFRINLKGSTGQDVNETTTDHQYDLSRFIWASEERYMDVFYVTVTATQGGSQSEAVKSKTFSFNIVKTRSIECQLEFPPVVVTEKDSVATVSFTNPFSYYTELKQASKSKGASFVFTVTSEAGDVKGSCRVEEENCKREGVGKCVRLTGLLFDEISVGQVSFNETQLYCVSESAEFHAITLVVLLSIVVLVTIVLTIIICRAKAWTMKTSETPKSLLPNDREQIQYDVVSDMDAISVRVTVHEPRKAPSVSSEEDNNPKDNLQDSSGSSDCHHRADEDSVKTECYSMDSEAERDAVSPYDCPHNLQVDMGDGEMVSGYSQR